jgi:hypothetical protein
MDFNDVFRLLLYIAIPLVIASNRKAKKAKKSSQQRRQPSPAQNAGGGLMGRIESMMREMEKAAEAQKSSGRARTAGEPAATPQGMHTETGQTLGGISGGPGERPEGKIPVWQVARTDEEEAVARQPKGAEPPVSEYKPAAAQKSSGLFGRDDLVKGIIMSEILQPPVTKRPNKRHPY